MTADEIQSDYKNGSYRIDREYSVIEWTGRNPDTEHVGTSGHAAGRLVVAGTGITGEFKIDMNALKSTSLRGHELRPVLEAHLKSHDFFFVKLFPWVWFRLRQAAPPGRTDRGRSAYDIRGEPAICLFNPPIAGKRLAAPPDRFRSPPYRWF